MKMINPMIKRLVLVNVLRVGVIGAWLLGYVSFVNAILFLMYVILSELTYHFVGMKQAAYCVYENEDQAKEYVPSGNTYL